MGPELIGSMWILATLWEYDILDGLNFKILTSLYGWWVHFFSFIYIYIYGERERERERVLLTTRFGVNNQEWLDAFEGLR